MNQSFWRGRRVLVTGHTGFKGSWLTLLLADLGADVVGLSLDPPTKPSLFETARVAEGITSIHGDVCDVPELVQLLKKTEPSVVVHMAAQSLVRESYRDPLETYRTNVMGTVAVLEAARVVPAQRAVLVVTSDKVYENDERDTPFRESDRLGGRDPYSNSKGCAEFVASAYRESFFPPDDMSRHAVALATARAGNVIGGGDWAKDRIVPDIVTALSEGRAPLIRNPGAHRPWQHVLDALLGYVVLLERLATDPEDHAEAWNFGPSEESVRPVSMLAEDICRLWGHGARWDLDHGPKPHEASRLSLDSTKARTRLELGPSLDYRTALAWTVDWYRAFHAGADMRQATLDQIRGFRERHA
jgi:CDP-glucose 4,6-dehydratase